jgi:hypothetical protein
MIPIGADRFRSKAAASPEYGAGSGGNVNDFYKQLEAINQILAEMRPKLEMVVEIRTKLDAVLPHLATKAELEAMRSDLIRWAIGAAVTSAGVAAALATVASHVSWH